METKTEQRLKAQVARFQAIARDKLGDGIWGLETKDKFTHEEILFLFARIFPILGFNSIKEIRTGFPDCICMKDNRKVGIEFEPVLSFFGDHIHKHDLNSCQYIVCWEDDLNLDDSVWEEIKKFNIEIFQLKQIYDEIGRPRPKKIMDLDKLKLGVNQLKILKAFIHLGKDILSREEIAEVTGVRGKALGGPLGALILLAKGRIGWIVKQHPDKRWEINPQHKTKIIAKLKEYNL